MKFRIFVNGKNFLFKEEEGIIPSGFYTNVFVEAQSEESAELEAIKILQEDEELSNIVVNESTNLPILTVLEIDQLERWPEGVSLPRTRLEVYNES